MSTSRGGRSGLWLSSEDRELEVGVTSRRMEINESIFTNYLVFNVADGELTFDLVSFDVNSRVFL